MKLRMIFSCTILLIVTAFGQFINNEQVMSVSDSGLEGKLLDSSIVQDGPPVESSAAGPEPFNPALGADFDPDVFASNQLWEGYISKGSYLFCLMIASGETAGRLMGTPRTPPSASSPWVMDDIIRLGLNYWPKFNDRFQPANGENVCLSILHWDCHRALPEYPYERPWPIRGQMYRTIRAVYARTGGTYKFAVNVRDGVTIARQTLSPRTAVRHPFSWGREVRPDELPELQHVTDIHWGFWIKNNPNIKNFRGYGVENVVNDHTVLLVTRALRNRRKFALEIWPGVMFEKGSEEYMALIGSPIGDTIANFLITHKPWLGLKHVTHVIVVCDGNDQDTCARGMNKMHLFFTVEDAHFENEEGIEGNEGNRETGRIESHVFHVRDDGKQVVREHKVTANLWDEVNAWGSRV
ncbi:hypothetical protein GGP41_004095 [Bipolaris sorokiniana]|uniref:Uncharacterized protein n=1 Tax=Cochliobolus sativus TaxID=45130 RepID=A0A8H5ZL58_COCSA|nr:hypothetical protein GGP41_004095 [Bipolaris sorokiniana]